MSDFNLVTTNLLVTREEQPPQNVGQARPETQNTVVSEAVGTYRVPADDYVVFQKISHVSDVTSVVIPIITNPAQPFQVFLIVKVLKAEILVPTPASGFVLFDFGVGLSMKLDEGTILALPLYISQTPMNLTVPADTQCEVDILVIGTKQS